MFEIEIRKLFGRFDYRFLLLEDHITILTGPNGFGKSTIIRCLNALGNSNLKFFLELEFVEFKVISSKKSLTIEKTQNGLRINGEEIDGKYILSRGKGQNPGDDQNIHQIYTDILRALNDFLGNVYFIAEQRLIQENANRTINRTINRMESYYSALYNETEKVVEIPKRLKQKIADIGVAYSGKANSLDSTYPERLFRQKCGITEKEFHINMNLMKEKIEKLDRYGISDIKALDNVEFNPEDARALKVYFDDFNEKYDVYRDFLERLDYFGEIVNSRFMFKQLVISREYGLKIIDIDTKRKIPLTNLSSGEKEIIVLFYTLLFEIPDGVLLLIDEPEISLHIAWQRLFMKDLKKIVQMKNLRAVIATHSPQIVSGNRDIQVDLGELYKDGFNKRM
ncbi:MAG: AAA family ATPase [Clostridia bacterium]|nr:AAA family ATPase [Clostridia bacterium]